MSKNTLARTAKDPGGLIKVSREYAAERQEGRNKEARILNIEGSGRGLGQHDTLKKGGDR